ncbi:MAG TPA: glycosyltransferase [Rubrobacteraceae bacterium]|nr:glycosyltransferase [Rubrobacteraceae bacterium]
MSAGERRPRILFATIAAGGGHVAVARAMAEAIEHHYPGRFELRVSDYMKEVGPKKVADLDRLHKDIWRFMLRYPILARGSQRLMDAFPRLTIATQRRLVRGFARAAADDLRRDPPRLIFSNHGLMTAGLAEAKRIGGLEVPVLSFANELVGICSYWADPHADHIVVPSEEARRDLTRFGVPESKLSYVGFGYPVRQAFLDAPPKPEARKRLGLEDRFTCLVSSGGEGVGRNQLALVRALLDSYVPLQVVVIAGRNEGLKKKLRALGTGKSLLRIEGYVEDMATYLAASDVFVGKAGPASVFEAIVVGRPALVTGYAGLNEVGVARLVEERGLGRYVRTPEELLQEVRRYTLDPALLEEVARRCRELDPAAATERLAHYVVRFAGLGKHAA